MLSIYPINSRVKIRISRQIPAGLLGRLVGGPRAIVRNREIAWGDPLPGLRYIGQTREAVVIGYNAAYDQLEVSLRFVERDPWQQVATSYPCGKQVSGRVVGLTAGAAYVELEPGVEGLLPIGEIETEAESRGAGWLWIHDWVKVLIKEVDPARRRLRVSLKEPLIQREAERRRQLWAGQTRGAATEVVLAEILPFDTRVRLLQMVSKEDSTAIEPELTVLVVEDDPVYAAGLKNFLEQNGCQVTVVGDGMAGLGQALRQVPPYHLIVVDWNLPKLKGHELIQKLQEGSCASRLVMVLEPAPLQGQPEVWAKLQASEVDIFSKTEGECCREGLIAIVRELRGDGTAAAEPQRYPFPQTAPPIEAEGRPAPAANGGGAGREAQRDVAAILAQLEKDTQAGGVMLLRLDPGTGGPGVETCTGRCLPLEWAAPDIIHSPLGDLLHKGMEVAGRASVDPIRFKRLLDLLTFDGLLGIPVPAVREMGYGLVLLKEQGGFGEQDVKLARLAAYLLAGIIQERRLAEILQPWQSQSLVGQLLNSVVHEVTNKLGGLDYQVEVLRNGLKELIRRPENAVSLAFLRRMEQAVDGIAELRQGTEDLRHRYLGLTVIDEPQAVDLTALANEIVGVLRTEAQQLNIVLAVKIGQDLAHVWARPSQLRQVLLNLMLNSIQHMGEIKRSGTVTIDMGYVPNSSLPVQVRIVDEGPGIHAQLWERVFDFGFTTKKGGAGLGLTISREVAERLWGRLSVEESYVLWGTTFLLELPKGG